MHLIRILLLSMLTACSADASTELSPSSPAPSATDTERLSADVPDGWVKLIDKTVGDLYITEFYPPQDAALIVAASASGADWQQKLAIEVLRGTALPDPIEFVQGLADGQAEACEAFAAQPVFAGFENGYPTVVQILQCPRAKGSGNGLLNMVKVIQGNKALYSISRLWRTAAPAIPRLKQDEPAPLVEVPVPADQIAAWSATLRRYTLCDTELAAHRCSQDETRTAPAAAP